MKYHKPNHSPPEISAEQREKMKNRKEGYYWVKWDGEWTIAWWDYNWLLSRGNGTWQDYHMDEIDENIIEHKTKTDEPQQI